MFKSIRRRHSRRSTVVACLIALLTLISSGVFAGSAQASGIASMVDNIVVQDTYSTLSLRFDEPITAEAAERARASLQPTSEEEVTASEERWRLSCGNRVTFIDSNGTFDVAYYCGTLMQRGLTRTLPWGYKLSAKVQAIVVGDVVEKGLTWWNDGAFGGQNSPHVEPPSYHFHGTMKPVYPNSNVDCQDYLTFRHNIGPGGTGSVTFAAALRLVG